MAYSIPNSADAAVAAQAAPDAVDFTVLAGGMAQTGVESGLVATVTGSDMKVSLTAGKVRIANSIVSIAAGTATIGTAHATLNRFDIVTATTGGTVAVTAGAASSNPVFPTLGATSVALYAVYVGAAATAIVSNRLVDKRVILADGADFLAYAYF